MDDFIYEYGAWGLFVSAFISSTIAPGGSEAVMVYLLSEGKIDNTTLLLSATIGNTLGALTTWLLGGLAARGYPVEKIDSGKHEKALGIVRKWGVIALLFSWLPVIGDALCFAAGWLKLKFNISLFLIALGKFLRYAFLVYLFS